MSLQFFLICLQKYTFFFAYINTFHEKNNLPALTLHSYHVAVVLLSCTHNALV